MSKFIEDCGSGLKFQRFDAVELDYFHDLIAFCKGNIMQMAKVSGLSRSTVHRHIDRLSLTSLVDETREARRDI